MDFVLVFMIPTKTLMHAYYIHTLQQPTNALKPETNSIKQIKIKISNQVIKLFLLLQAKGNK